MNSRSIIFVATLILGATAATIAHAQPSTGEAAARPGGHRVSAELDFFHEGAASTAVFAPSFYGRFRLVDARHGLDAESGGAGFVVDLDAKWRGTGLVGDASTFRAGNPYIGVRLGSDSNDLTARAGAGVTLPLTNLYDEGLDDLFGYYYGIALHGAWDAHLLTPQTFAFVVPFDLQFRTSVFTVGGDGAFAVIAFVPKEGDAGDPYIAMQLGAYGAFLPIPQLAVGLRFQAVVLTDTDGSAITDDEGYLALAPFVRLDLEGFFAEARLYMNLDEPFGFAFDTGRVWSISLSAGADF